MDKKLWWTVPVPWSLASDGRIPLQARFLYMILSSQADYAKTVRISLRVLVRLSGISSREVVWQRLGQLVEAGWLAIDRGRGQRASEYKLVGPRSARRPPVQMPAYLVADQSVPMAAKCLYALLLALGAPETREIALGRVELIGRAGIGSDNSVRAAIRDLRDRGWLRVERHAKEQLFVYEPLDPHLTFRQAERDRVERRLADKDFAGEALMQLMLTALVADDEFTDNARPGKITNPYTGESLEFDRWYMEKGVAFEFNGPQHDGPTELFPDPRKAQLQRGRDLMKAGLALEHGIKLIVVKSLELTFPVLVEKIGDALPLRTMREEDPVIACLTEISRRYVQKVRHS